MALAMALLSPTPQVTAIRATAIDGACGPWSTPATRAASSRAACATVGMSPRTMSQIIAPNPVLPMRSWTGMPRSSMTFGSMRDTAVPHQSATSASVMRSPYPQTARRSKRSVQRT
jgi:hypothetical protein